jgi:site-specific DNA recombinase
LAPLGYDNDRDVRKIVVNEDEAAQVRGTIELYLECQSIRTIKEIDRRGWKNKLTVTKSGKERGGRQFDKSSLFKLLTNVAYLGKVRYKDEIHEGAHDAIVLIKLWEKVQKQLKHNGRTGGIMVRNKFDALLKGLVRCVCCDCSMTPNHTTKGGNTRARVSQIMHLRLLAPDLQERLLFLIRVVGGRNALCLRSLQPIALASDWPKQREKWDKLFC